MRLTTASGGLAALAAGVCACAVGAARSSAMAQEPAAVDSTAAAASASAATAVPVDSAAALRAALERPPGRPGFDVLEAVALPFRVATFPLHLAIKGAGELAELAAGPGPRVFYVRAFRDVVRWGLEPGITSIGPRSGPALELELTRWLPVFLETAYSIRESQRHRVGVRFGREDAPPRVEAAFGFHRDAEPHFWGLGAGTRPEAESDFLHDRVFAQVQGAVPLVPGVRLRAHGGWEDNRVDRGFDGSEPDLQDQFDPASLFGADERTEFLRVGIGALIDLAPRRLFRRRGVELEVGATQFAGIEGTDADFHRLRARASGFVPLNDVQTLTLHGGVESNDGDSGRGVPFTHTAALGDDVGGRGYDDQRFRGRDKAFVAAEWRFMAWRELRDRAQLEGFVFFEEGVVASDLGEVSSSDWRPSWGGGLRFEDREGLVLESYLAGGEEGVRVQVETGVSF